MNLMGISPWRFAAVRPAVVFGKGKPEQPTPEVVLQPKLFAPWDAKTPGLTRFAVIGDAGSGTRTQWGIARQLAKTWEQQPFASVLALGDNVYENGEPRLFDDRIHKPYKKLFDHNVRFFPILGNHDVNTGFGHRQLAYWGAPQYYSFSQGPVDFFALDTTPMLPGYDGCYTENAAFAGKITETQLTWLDKALGDSKAPFKVVYGHYPLYSSGTHAQRQDTTLKLRNQLEPLLVKHGVDLYLAGHEHHYERSKLIQGIQHIISGAAGKLRKIFFADTPPYPREKALSKNHFMLFDIQDQALTYQVLSGKGKILDTGRIEKKQLSLTA